MHQASDTITGVTEASRKVGDAANDVLGSAGALNAQSGQLKTQVAAFLATVRAA